MTNTAVAPMSDETLAAQATADNADAFNLLVRRHHEACQRFAERMLRDATDAEDAVQETFMRAYLSREKYNPAQPYRAWLFSILINCCRTFALQRSRRERRFTPLENARPTDLAEASGTLTDTALVREVVDALDPILREAFLLKYVEEMDYREMSLALGAGVSALKMRVKRACETLRPRLKELYDER